MADFYRRAKELEHYQRVRHTFEGPSKIKTTSLQSTPAPTRIPAPSIDGHLHPPMPTTRPKPKSKNSTAKLKEQTKGKGKGKASQWNSDDDEEDDDDDAYVTSNDFMGTPERKKSETNGSFGDTGADDDEELYG